MADIIYTLEGGTYFNLTNKCPCNCAFCIRSKGDAVGDAKELWFDEEPTFDDIKNAIASINENNLTITPTAVGNVEISFVKKATNYEMPPIVYFSDHSQNALKPGYYDPVYSQFSIKIIAGSIEIHKLDKDTNSSNAQGNAVLEGAVYEIFDTDYYYNFLNISQNLY